MYYIKCNKCGHYNEVKTEYQVFCSHCDKKLENNYPEWKRHHPDQSFDAFKELICSTEGGSVEKTLPKRKSGRPRGLKYWIAFIVSFGIFYAVGHFAGEKIVGYFKKPAFDKAMMEMANEINKTCPFMVDAETRLDNAIALPDKVFQYNYTLVNRDKASLNLDELKSVIEPNIVNLVRTSPEMKTIRDNNTILKYYYKDKAGVYLFTITVTPEQYQ